MIAGVLTTVRKGIFSSITVVSTIVHAPVSVTDSVNRRKIVNFDMSRE